MVEAKQVIDQQMRHGQGPCIFGEVLYDAFPDGSFVLGGAPFNVAWHLNGFQQDPVFISRIGSDQLGQNILSSMEEWGMERQSVELDARRPTGTVNITFVNGEPNYTIGADQDAYGHIHLEEPIFPDSPTILYHGTLALWNKAVRGKLFAWKERGRFRSFVDVNLRAPWWEREGVLSLIEGASWVKMNEDELHQLAPECGSLEKKGRWLLDHYGCEGLLLTRGKDGAVWWGREGDYSTVAPAVSTEVVDTVGAGDGFSSVFLLGLLQGWPIPKSMAHAQEFASLIVSRRGAVIGDRHVYQELLSVWNSST